MQDKIYALTDIQSYASQMRYAAASSLSENSEDGDLDSYISIKQIINLINHHCIGFDTDNRPLLNETANDKIYEDTVIWIHNVGLAKLAAKNLIECAWDDSTNQMIFWVKDSTNHTEVKNAKPKRKRRKNPRKDKDS